MPDDNWDVDEHENDPNYCTGSMGLVPGRCGSNAFHYEHWIGDEPSTGGYPSNDEITKHFERGGPHARGDCAPVCTFGDY